MSRVIARMLRADLGTMRFDTARTRWGTPPLGRSAVPGQLPHASRAVAFRAVPSRNSAIAASLGGSPCSVGGRGGAAQSRPACCSDAYF